MAASELQLASELASNLSPKSKLSFKTQFIHPSIEIGVVAMTHPENPRHPRQKYYLTELGLAVLEVLKQQSND
jgi:ATP-dependent DNA helicase RecG